MNLSISVCTYRRPNELRECLKAIHALGYARAHEVLVVDNSDRPEDRRQTELLVRECAGARLLTSAPPGLSRARNAALAAATGDVIAYLDDDATCVEGWAEAYLAAFEDQDVVVAGGPILPRWETPPPEWLGGELLLALAVQNRGPVARDLRDEEFLYGANLAFRREALAATGGFSEQLGRSGTGLMGDEEIDVQRRLRPRGRSRHVPGARVYHLMQKERCTVPWFVKRYAWQGLSDVRTGDAGTLAWLGSLVENEGPPSARTLVADLLGTPPRSTEDVVGRARLVRGLVGALLDDRVPVPRGTASAPARTRSIDDPEFHAFKAEVPSGTEVLFVEFGVSHAFLFEAYGRLPGASLVNPRLEPAQNPTECARFLDDAVYFASRSGIRAVVLLTADVLTWPGFETALSRPTPGVEVHGFLHRLPADGAGLERLRLALERLTGMFVYSEFTRRLAEEQFGARNVTVVPIPPLFFANAKPREARKWTPEARVALGLLGEVRPGKGYEFAVAALAAAPLRLRDRVRILMAGRAEESTERLIRDTCAAGALVSDLVLSTRSERGYRAIPDSRFAAAIGATDVMVYPFERDLWNVQSAHFADALLAGSWFLAAKDTLIGDLVERHRVGRTFQSGSEASFLAALDALFQDVESDRVPAEGRRRLLALHEVGHTCRVVEEVLRAGSASRSALSEAN